MPYTKSVIKQRSLYIQNSSNTKDHLPRPDHDAVCYANDKGEFDPYRDTDFNQHLNKLNKFTQFAKKKFPCSKAKEFLNYVLSKEPWWYDTRIDLHKIS